MSIHTAQGTLTPLPPFDFAHSTHFLQQFSPALGEQTVSDGVLTKAFSFDGRIIVCRLQSTGTVDTPQLTYTLFADSPLDEDLRGRVVDRLTFFLSLEDDLRPFYALAQDDPAFAPVIELLYGYHQVKFPTPFENAAWAILSQRNVWAVSRMMKDQITLYYGGIVAIDDMIYRTFPEPAGLLSLSPLELGIAVGNRQKVERLQAVARAFDGVDEHWLRTAPYDEAEAWLRGIKGIGAWSASFILLRGAGRIERLPVMEKWTLEAARRVYSQFNLLLDDLRALAAPYGVYQGYWTHYLRVAV